MTDEFDAANPSATGQLARALASALSHNDAATRRRASVRASQWLDVIRGMADGRLDVGSRRPMTTWPTWVTPDVMRGGFALPTPAAAGAMEPDEIERCDSLGLPHERAELFASYLTDEGLSQLRAQLASGGYRVNVPEDSALLTMVWLLDNGDGEAAIDLIGLIGPFADRLRFMPRADAVAPMPTGLVSRRTAGEAAAVLASARPNRQVEAQREALAVWLPLSDEFVALWWSTRDDAGAVGARWGSAHDGAARALLTRYEETAAAHVRRRLGGERHGSGRHADATAGTPSPSARTGGAGHRPDRGRDRAVRRGAGRAGPLPDRAAGRRALCRSGSRPADTRTYRAFRDRRSLLLLNLQRQVQFEEVPWVAACAAHASGNEASDALDVASGLAGLAIDSFPGTILPNPLIQELATHYRLAGLDLALTEELAADIFMGRFAPKLLISALSAGRLLTDSLYARYFDLDYNWPASAGHSRRSPAWSRPSAARPSDRQLAAFERRCAEAAGRDVGSSVAANGIVIERCQQWTSHNLAVLLADGGVELHMPLEDLAIEAAWRTNDLRALADGGSEGRRRAAPMSQVLAGLRHVADGGRFDQAGRCGTGRRLTGWTLGPHWALTDAV